MGDIDQKLQDVQQALTGKLLVNKDKIDKLPSNLQKMLPDGLALEQLGKGVTKKVFQVRQEPVVVSAVSNAKERVIEAEIKQLLAIQQAGLRIPPMLDNPLFDVYLLSNDGKTPLAGLAFTAKYIDSVLVPGKTSKSDFYKDTKDIYAQHADEREQSTKDLQAILAYLDNGNQIYDFQVLIEKSNGKVYVFDPGDPENSENFDYRPMIKGWLDELAKFK